MPQRYAVRVQRVEHIILDNLQFMLQLDTSDSMNRGLGGGFGAGFRFDLQDRALGGAFFSLCIYI